VVDDEWFLEWTSQKFKTMIEPHPNGDSKLRENPLDNFAGLVYSLNSWAKGRIGNLRSVKIFDRNLKEEASLGLFENEPILGAVLYEGEYDVSEWLETYVESFRHCVGEDAFEAALNSGCVTEFGDAFADDQRNLLGEAELLGGPKKKKRKKKQAVPKYIISEDGPYFLWKYRRDEAYTIHFPDNPNELVVGALFSISEALDRALANEVEKVGVKMDFETYYCSTHRDEFHLGEGKCPHRHGRNDPCGKVLKPIRTTAFVVCERVRNSEANRYLFFYGEERDEGVPMDKLLETCYNYVSLPAISAEPVFRELMEKWKYDLFTTSRTLTVASFDV